MMKDKVNSRLTLLTVSDNLIGNIGNFLNMYFYSLNKLDFLLLEGKSICYKYNSK